MKPVAIIPARGGSKRLPRKNILPLNGKPIITYAIEAALKSGVFGGVIVSSEDDEILNIAEEAKAKCYKRPEGLAEDRSTVVEVCCDVLNHYNIERFCCIYATSVLLSAETLLKSEKVFSESIDCDVLMGVAKFNYSPVQALQVDDNGFASLLHSSYKGVQSQFYPKFRVSCGGFYWGKKDTFINERTFYSKNLKVFDMPENEILDLDTPEDFERLKRMVRVNSERNISC